MRDVKNDAMLLVGKDERVEDVNTLPPETIFLVRAISAIIIFEDN